MKASASSPRATRRGTKNSSIAKAEPFVRVRRRTDAEIEAAAARDADNPMTPETRPSRLCRVSMARQLRLQLGLSQPDFARLYGIPLGTLRDWKQHHAEPDQAAGAYLQVIAKEPARVRKALEPT
jgi:putative transcriptional regulator